MDFLNPDCDLTTLSLNKALVKVMNLKPSHLITLVINEKNKSMAEMLIKYHFLKDYIKIEVVPWVPLDDWAVIYKDNIVWSNGV